MRKLIRNLTNVMINPLKLTALKTKDLNALLQQREAITALYNARCLEGRRELSNSTACIVFSKDRALQLHALLGSYFALVANPVPVHVLFRASTKEHAQAYEEVFTLFADRPVNACPQSSPSSFKQDLVALLANQSCDKVFFLVDDIIFVEPTDLNHFTSFDTDLFVPSLRLGQNLSFCYTVHREQPLPPWSLSPHCPPSMVCWQWQAGELDWAYPLSVDGHLFARWEVLAMTENVHFTAPNSYEYALQQFLHLFHHRYGVAYKKSVIVNIPWNRVQKENDNLSGGIHQDYLLEQWREGKQIDYQKLYGMANVSAHQEVSLILGMRGN
jgi:hypothetical protein